MLPETMNDLKQQALKLWKEKRLTPLVGLQQFLGYSDEQFRLFLEYVPTKSDAPKRTCTVHLHGGFISFNDTTTNETYFTKTIGFKNEHNLHHGQIVCVNINTKAVLDTTLGDDPNVIPVTEIHYAVVERDEMNQKLIIKQDVNHKTLKEYGCCFDVFYIGPFVDKFDIKEGDFIDIILNKRNYPFINWVYHIPDTNQFAKRINRLLNQQPKQPKYTVRPKTKSTIDYDLTDKKVAIFGTPPSMISNIESVLTKEKGAHEVCFQELGTIEQGFNLIKTKMFKDTDIVILSKTGISHGMSNSIIATCKENDIPFAVANQPTLKRIEMAIYRALTNAPSDEISAGNLQYPETH